MSISLSVMKRGIVLVLALGTLSGAVFANSTGGKIVGKLVDSETGDALIGANVFLQDTMIGAASDLDGAYEVKNIPPGMYNLVISIIGYAKKVVQNVQVTADDVVKFDIALEPEAIAAEDVIVTATMIRNTEASLLKDRQIQL